MFGMTFPRIWSRREVLLGAAASAGALAQDASLQVEITLTPVTRSTVRVSVQPIENGVPRPVPVTGALVQEGWGQPVVRIRALPVPRTVKCGDLSVTLSKPLTVRVESKNGRLIQELK